MEVPFALIADAANVSREGKLNILGIFDTITGRTFPLVHPEMKLVMRLEATASDFEERHTIEVRLMDEDGQPIFKLAGEVRPRGTATGRSVKVDQILSLKNVAFNRPGQYQFVISIDGSHKLTLPLTLVMAAPPGPQQAGPGPSGQA